MTITTGIHLTPDTKINYGCRGATSWVNLGHDAAIHFASADQTRELAATLLLLAERMDLETKNKKAAERK